MAKVAWCDETGAMDLVTVTIRDDVPRPDGTWAAVDTWGREVVVTFRDGPPGLRSLRRGQAVRGRLQGHLVVDAVL